LIRLIRRMGEPRCRKAAPGRSRRVGLVNAVSPPRSVIKIKYTAESYTEALSVAGSLQPGGGYRNVDDIRGRTGCRTGREVALCQRQRFNPLDVRWTSRFHVH